MADYDFRAVEAKWQSQWRDHPLVRRSPEEAPKYYVLHMMPQPSPQGFHLGHAYGFVAADILARFKQMSGYAVLHPLGWDAFCAEISKAARVNNRDPEALVAESVPRCRQELEGLGIGCDWDREFISSAPGVVAGSRWIFELLHNSWFDAVHARARPISDLPIPDAVCQAGPAAVAQYQDRFRLVTPERVTVWWSEATGVVPDAEAADIELPLERKTALAWRVRITSYADRLIDDLEHVHWPRSVSEQQRQWVGRRAGFVVRVQLERPDGADAGAVDVFVDRPELLFGVTMLMVTTGHSVLPPIDPNRPPLIQPRLVKGLRARAPISGELIPIIEMPDRKDGTPPDAWIGVPAHDERAFEIARTYQFGIRPVVVPLVASGDGLSAELREAVIEADVPYAGEGEMLPQDSALFRELNLACCANSDAGKRVGEWLVRTKNGRPDVRYRLNDWSFSRAAGWGEEIPISFSSVPETGQVDLTLATMPRWMAASWYCLAALRETVSDVSHGDRPWSVGLEGIWSPVDLFISGSEHAGQYLLYARFMHKVLFDRGLVSTSEPFLDVRLNGKILGVEYRDRHGNQVPSALVEQLPGGSARHRDTGARLDRVTRAMARGSGNAVWVGRALADFGSDALRLSLLVSVTGEASRIWEPSTVAGIQRFMRRIWKQIVGESVSGVDSRFLETVDDLQGRRHIAAMVLRITTALEARRPHLAFAALRESYGAIFACPLSRSSVSRFVRLLAPFAPHLAEELWSRLGNTSSVHQVPWPKINPVLLESTQAQLLVQRDGRTLGMRLVGEEVTRAEIPALVAEYLVGLEQHLLAAEVVLVVEPKQNRTWIGNVVSAPSPEGR